VDGGWPVIEESAVANDFRVGAFCKVRVMP
jgi:hypothetical protein